MSGQPCPISFADKSAVSTFHVEHIFAAQQAEARAAARDAITTPQPSTATSSAAVSTSAPHSTVSSEAGASRGEWGTPAYAGAGGGAAFVVLGLLVLLAARHRRVNRADKKEDPHEVEESNADTELSAVTSAVPESTCAPTSPDDVIESDPSQP